MNVCNKSQTMQFQVPPVVMRLSSCIEVVSLEVMGYKDFYSNWASAHYSNQLLQRLPRQKWNIQMEMVYPAIARMAITHLLRVVYYCFDCQLNTMKKKTVFFTKLPHLSEAFITFGLWYDLACHKLSRNSWNSILFHICWMRMILSLLS